MKIEYLHDAEARQTAAFAILAVCGYFTRLNAPTVTCLQAQAPQVADFSVVE
jgi:hypothetical protein